MAETILTLADVEARLQELRAKYGITCEEFERHHDARLRVSDDDEFEWEAFLHHREALREQEGQLHREYINRLTTGEPAAILRGRSQAMLAA